MTTDYDYIPPPGFRTRLKAIWDWSEVVSGFIALLVFAAVFYGAVSFAYDRWNAEVQSAKHPVGWVSHTGTVTSLKSVNYQNTSPGGPVLPAYIQYNDYENVQHVVGIDMPTDTTHIGEQVKIWVQHKTEAVYVPKASDCTDQLCQNPRATVPTGKAKHTAWPAAGFVFGAIVAAIAGLITWLFLLEFLDWATKFKGRLGTR